ncbi:MAG: ABC transporter permease [Mediterraneibacter gnavus]
MKKTEDANKRIAKQAAASKSMESPWRLAMKRLSRNKLAIAGLIFLGVMIVLCIVGPIVSPYSDITATDIANAKQPPSAQHWFGTDENGRDVFTRLLYGGRISMTVGLAATALQIFIGALLGCTQQHTMVELWILSSCV